MRFELARRLHGRFTQTGKELALGKTTLSKKDALTIDQAREILRSVAVFDHTTISEDMDLSCLGGYHFELIRQAIRVVAVDLIGKKDEIVKQTPFGKASLFANPGFHIILLNLGSDGNRVSITEQVEFFDSEEVGNLSQFREWRHSISYPEHYMSLNTPLDILKYQYFGLRWLAANMVDWRTEKFHMPEDISKGFRPALTSPALELPSD